jgi:hypothetical protein
MLLLKLLCLAVCFGGGVTVHRWAARRWFDATASVDERELLVHGLLAAILINGTAGTWLALARLFYLPAFTLLFAAGLFILREDAAASWRAARALLGDFARDVERLRPIALLAAACWLGLGLVLAMLCRIPTQNVDAWVFHLPLAFSMVEHHGFIYPQIGHLFYASQPLFFNVLFAQALLVEPDFVAAALVNVPVYLLTLASLAMLCGRRRALALLLLTLAIGASPFFTSMVPLPTTDVSRSCLSVLGLLYALVYLQRRTPYFAGLAALFLGGAIATKYTEGVAMLLFCAVLLAAQWRKPDWCLVGKCAGIVILVAAYWYVKNLVLLGNPLYPFLFGHAGLTDAWMADYMIEMKTPFDPALRHFSHDLLSLAGWRDFFSAFWQLLLARRPGALLTLALGGAGLLVAPRRIGPLLALTFALLVFWYLVMFNHVRWAIAAYMLMHATGCYAVILMLEKFRPGAPAGTITPPLPVRLPLPRLALAAAVAAILFLAVAGWRGREAAAAIQTRLATMRLPKAVEPVIYAFLPGGADRYLERTRPGYALYKRVITDNLRGVYQPYDLGVKRYAATYNNSVDGNWFVDIYDTPAGLAAPGEFAASRGIGYFITVAGLDELERDQLTPARLAAADRVVESLKPGARLLLEDANGWKLYQVAQGAK